MNKIKKLILLIFVLVVSLSLAGCTTEIALPDLTGKTSEEVRKYFAKSRFTNYQISIKQGLYYSGDPSTVTVYEYDKFYGYAGYNAGDKIKNTTEFYIYVTASSAPTSISNFLERFYDDWKDREGFDVLAELYDFSFPTESTDKVNRTSTSSDFTSTGFGEVTVTGYVDGDTTRFRDKSGDMFSLLYLGINTPESTASFQAWGKAASNFTHDALSTAKKVVLEAEEPGQSDDNGRYLGWVWYQDQSDEWHLLNMELVMYGLAYSKSNATATYSQLVSKIGSVINSTGCRIYGEKDPDYDYSTKAKEVSIKELKENFATYYSKKVKVTGVLAFLDGKAPVLMDPDNPGYGIYYYIPSFYTGGGIADIIDENCIGHIVTMEGVATYYTSSSLSDEEMEDYIEEIGETGLGCPQLTNFKEGKAKTVTDEDGNPKTAEVTALELDLAKLNGSSDSDKKYSSQSLGAYVTCTTYLKVVDKYINSSRTGYNIYCEDLINGYKITIRVDDSNFTVINPSSSNPVANPDGIDYEDFEVNDIITSIEGYLSYYKPYSSNYSGYQIVLAGNEYITFYGD